MGLGPSVFQTLLPGRNVLGRQGLSIGADLGLGSCVANTAETCFEIAYEENARIIMHVLTNPLIFWNATLVRDEIDLAPTILFVQDTPKFPRYEWILSPGTSSTDPIPSSSINFYKRLTASSDRDNTKEDTKTARAEWDSTLSYSDEIKTSAQFKALFEKTLWIGTLGYGIKSSFFQDTSSGSEITARIQFKQVASCSATPSIRAIAASYCCH